MGKIIKNGNTVSTGIQNYSNLSSKPSLNGETIENDKTAVDYNIVWIGTSAEYDALATKNPACLYLISDIDSSYDFANVFNKSEILALLNNKQSIADTSFETTGKTVPLAINELNSKIKNLGGMVQIKVVSETPTSPVNGTMYYIQASAGSTTYNIKLYNDDTWTDMGTTSVDLSTYQKKDWTNSSYTAQTIEGALGEIATNYVKQSDVVDSLTSTETQKPLSANQGKVLDEEKEDVSNKTTSISSSSTDDEYPSAKAVYKYTDDTYLPLAGGTMTGAIVDGQTKSYNTGTLTTNSQSNYIQMFGGNTYESGTLRLYGNESSGTSGEFHLYARTSQTNYKGLIGKPDGTLTWGGNDLCGNTETSPTRNTTYISTNYTVYWRVGKMIFIMMNFKAAAAVPSGSTLFTDLPTSAGKGKGILIGSDGSAAVTTIDSNSLLKLEGPALTSGLWYSGLMYYRAA